MFDVFETRFTCVAETAFFLVHDLVAFVVKRTD